MTFTRTVGGVDPWSMPSDGTDFVRIGPKTKAWERRQYAKASRRESKKVIAESLRDCFEA